MNLWSSYQVHFCSVQSDFNYLTQLLDSVANLLAGTERTKQMEEILNFQKPSEGLELVILLHTQY